MLFRKPYTLSKVEGAETNGEEEAEEDKAIRESSAPANGVTSVKREPTILPTAGMTRRTTSEHEKM